LYVKPREAEPKIEIDATETADKKMQLIVKNTGTIHKILKDVTYVAQTPEKKEFTFPVDTERAIGTQNILAGKSRKFIVPWPKEIPVVPLKVSVVDTKTLKK
jgi:fimbrial chaperone protein